MSEIGSQIIFKQLLDRQRVQIPMIQRDYAQGRSSESEVREEFLSALHQALSQPPGHESLPLNLDFIYGGVEGTTEPRFLPLDGQQRLTTLFLLHWYLAWTDSRLEDFRQLFCNQDRSRFSYSVRPSSTEFFDALIKFVPKLPPNDIVSLRNLITDQQWYFRYWRLDPTIQSSITMLDAIHARFREAKGFFARLIDAEQPTVTFQLLDLKNFGLSDDLYIKMNARGKPLTVFETFKARYEQDLKQQFATETRSISGRDFPIAEFVAQRMDTTWADFFWAHRDKTTNLYDEAVMNLFWVIALITRNPESQDYNDDASTLRNSLQKPSYSIFHNKKWLDRNFTETLIALLESWNGSSKPLLTDSRYFDEKKIFERLIQSPTNLTLPEVMQFSAYTLFIRLHESSLDSAAFLEWMRVVYNLTINSYIERVEELRSSARGLGVLSPKSKDVLRHFSQLRPTDRIPGFSDQQVNEETLKASLILNHKSWRPLIDRAESHGYFRGQIEFLLDFCGATKKWKEAGNVSWSSDEHESLQKRFEDYLIKAETMFDNQGLRKLSGYRWQRALLALGNYFLPNGRQNDSFLVNSATEPASWKRLLRGASASRQIVQQLWDCITVDNTLQDQLDKIIAETKNLEPWRDALVRTPNAFEYCTKQCIRRHSASEIYLLSKTQMNGSHAELFTFYVYDNCLRDRVQQQQLRPFDNITYESVTGTESMPHVLLTTTISGCCLPFKIEFLNQNFHIRTARKNLEQLPDLGIHLCEKLGLTQGDEYLFKPIGPTEIELEKTLQELCKNLIAFSSKDPGHA